MARLHFLAMAALAAWSGPARAAEPVMVRCGREYQAAKSAGTLNGADWNAFRTPCADRLKAATAAAPAGDPVAVRAAAPAGAAPPPAPTGAAPVGTAAAPASAPGGGMAAMHARQRQCGAEWTAGKAALVAATPGLTWPKYWSQCNARIKAAGR